MTESKATPKTELTIAEVQKLRLDPGDILVITFPEDTVQGRASDMLNAIRAGLGTDLPIMGLMRGIETHVISDNGSREWLRGLIADEVSAQLAAAAESLAG